MQKKQLYVKIKLFQEKTCLGIQVVTFDIKNISEVEYEKNNIVFNISLLLTSVVVILGLVSPTMFKNISNKGFNIVVNNFNWVYLIVMLALVILQVF
ncbi:hypothetical protein [Paraclostridium sp. AKS81]|uniref:hypothetical protein n=1 Tax=Paraclostridium sp. AKS81 TaxID=2876117 RepID=UPI002958A8FE|nr:hypothetical protein [Paraclostridium sp. AKS81]